MPDNGTRAAVDVDRLAELVAERLARRLAKLLPADTTDFWIALVERAAAERRRAAALAGLCCACTNNPIKDALAGILPNGGKDGPADDGDATTAPLDTDPGDERTGPVGRG